MELWIRSQDKCNLAKIINIEIERTTIKGNTKCDEWYVQLGHYKTKERALEVLNEIQNMIKPTLINTEYHSEIKQGVDKLSFDVVMQPIEDKITYIQPNVVVYEMPKN